MGLLRSFFDLVESGGLSILFLLVFLEGNPAIGSFIPGQIIVIFIGFLISVKVVSFNLYWTIFLVFLGAFLGDLLGYYLGKRLGVKGLDMFGIKKTSKIYKASYSFFKKYGHWSIVLGREFNLTRAFIPFFAGCFKMRFSLFLGFAFFSCVFWALLSVYLGYYFGFIIVENFNFIMEFMLFLIVYFGIVFFIYGNFKTFYKEKATLVKKYSIHNFFFIGLLLLFIFIFLFSLKHGRVVYFNKLFSFLDRINMAYSLKFIFSRPFFYFGFLFMFLILILKKKFRMLFAYFWSLVFSFFFSFMISIFVSHWFGFVPFFSLILFTVFIFYLWILVKLLVENKKIKGVLTSVLTIVLFFSIIHKGMYTGNYFVSLFSFLIGVLETEFILILSHYQVFDKCLSGVRFGRS